MINAGISVLFWWREREREQILVALEEICEVRTSFYFGKNTILVPTFWGHS